MGTKKSMRINMNGEQYVDYLKYKDRPRFTKSQREALIVFGLYFSIAAVLGIIALGLDTSIDKDIRERTPSEPPEYFDFFGVPILMVIPSFVFILGAFAWLIHGMGFTIIRR